MKSDILPGLKPEASMTDVLISHIVLRSFKLDKPNRCCKLSWTPQMSSGVTPSGLLICAKEQICWTSFQNLQSISWTYAQLYCNHAMHVLWLHIQLNNFQAVHRSSAPNACNYQCALLIFSKHLISVFRAPFKVPHRYSNAVLAPFIVLTKALFHGSSARSALSRPARFICERKLPLQTLCREQQLALPVSYFS